MNYILFALMALLIIMMFRRSRKNKAAAEEKRSQLMPGVDIMTNFGLFGTVKDVDTADNKISLEISPGVVVTVHSQTVAKIIEPAVDTPASVVATDVVVPNDASELTLDLNKKDHEQESPEETIERLNKETKKDN